MSQGDEGNLEVLNLVLMLYKKLNIFKVYFIHKVIALLWVR